MLLVPVDEQNELMKSFAWRSFALPMPQIINQLIVLRWECVAAKHGIHAPWAHDEIFFEKFERPF